MPVADILEKEFIALIDRPLPELLAENKASVSKFQKILKDISFRIHGEVDRDINSQIINHSNYLTAFNTAISKINWLLKDRFYENDDGIHYKFDRLDLIINNHGREIKQFAYCIYNHCISLRDFFQKQQMDYEKLLSATGIKTRKTRNRNTGKRISSRESFEIKEGKKVNLRAVHTFLTNEEHPYIDRSTTFDDFEIPFSGAPVLNKVNWINANALHHFINRIHGIFDKSHILIKLIIMNPAMKNILRIFGVLLFLQLFQSCKKDEVPTLTTSEVVNFTGTGATTGGTIIDEGSARVIVRGVCWSTKTNPTIENSKTQDGAGDGVFTSQISDLDLSTTYYVRAYATNGAGTGYGNEISFKNPTTASITTTEASSITINSATSGGDVISDGGSPILSRGICWSISENPTIEDSVILNGSGTGVFPSNLSGLSPETTYYVRAFASSNLGTSYGNEISFVYHFPSCGTITDVDGNVYRTVTIGSQCWMMENLKTTTYNNGDLIGTTNSATFDISGESTPKYQWAYNGNEGNASTYGRLYTWFAVTDVRDLCPSGWHVPNRNDWNNLEEYLINNDYSYGDSGNAIAKSMAAAYGWSTSSVPGDVGNNQTSNNSSGFTGLPGGYRSDIGTFFGLGEYGNWSCSYYYWGSTYNHGIGYDSHILNGNESYTDNGVSVRCVMGVAPSCNTLQATNITSTGVTLNGAINAYNLSTIVKFDYSTSPGGFGQSATAIQSPVTGTNIINVSADISDLMPGTMYFFRIRAESSTGVTFGNIFTFTTISGTVTDVEGNKYNTIAIGTQLWMAENLKTTRYSNGDIIGSTTPATLNLSGESTPEYQWAYDGDESNVAAYGRLYTWYAVTDSRGVCPSGWHVPADVEWTTLTDYLTDNGFGFNNGDNIAKSMAAQFNWMVSTIYGSVGYHQDGNNKSGFEGPAGGFRSYYGAFGALGFAGYWLSSTESDSDNVRYRSLSGDEIKVSRYYDSKQAGLSVRCLKDN